MFLFINVKSKNLKSILNFLTFLFSYLLNQTSLTQKFKFNKINIIKITILKSPHIHKISQQHYSIIIYKIKILIFLFNIKKNIKIFKALFNLLFQDLNFKIFFFSNYCFALKFFNLNYLKFNHLILIINSYIFLNYFLKIQYRKSKIKNFFKNLNINGKFILFNKV